jgi:hypothetical protein
MMLIKHLLSEFFFGLSFYLRCLTVGHWWWFIWLQTILWDSPVNKEIQKIREIKKRCGSKGAERGRRMPRANIKIPEPERYGRAVSLLVNRQSKCCRQCSGSDWIRINWPPGSGSRTAFLNNGSGSLLFQQKVKSML